MPDINYVSNLSDGTNTYVIMDEGAQRASNLVTSVSASSTDSQYPSAKLFYDTIVDIETILHNINSGTIEEESGIEEVNLTIQITGAMSSGFQSITINNETHTRSEFTNDSLTIQVPANTDLPYEVTISSSAVGIYATPSSGTLNLSDDYTLEINCHEVGGGEVEPDPVIPVRP